RNSRRHDIARETIQYQRAHLYPNLLPHAFPLPKRVSQEPFDLPNIRAIVESSGSHRSRRNEFGKAQKNSPSRLRLDANGAIWGPDVAPLGRRSGRPGPSASPAEASGARQVGVKRALRMQPRVGVARGAAEARLRSIDAGYVVGSGRAAAERTALECGARPPYPAPCET